MNNKIKSSIDEIKLPEGAEERMYANIMKKAQSAEKQSKPKIKLIYGASAVCAAACIALICTAVIKNSPDTPDTDISVSDNITASETAVSESENITSETESTSVGGIQVIPGMTAPAVGGAQHDTPTETEAPMLGGGLFDESTSASEQGEMACNPFAEENTLDDIIAAGLNVTLPEGAEIILCKVWEDGQKDIRFELDGHKYYYSASGEDGDFSGIYDTAKETESMDNGAVLEYTSMGYYKIHWSGETYNYYFSNTDGADKDTVIELSELMEAQAQ